MCSDIKRIVVRDDITKCLRNSLIQFACMIRIGNHKNHCHIIFLLRFNGRINENRKQEVYIIV